MILLACCPCASALDPSLDINQYAHSAWTVRQGFFQGIINAIAQTPDGYLWLGTDSGLLRFDGVRSIPWQAPKDAHLPSNYIRALLAARDGRLWIGTLKGLASWKDGKLVSTQELAGQEVLSLLEDREGTIWASGIAITMGRLCAIHRGSTQCYGEDSSLGRAAGRLFEDSVGNLWAGAMTGLWRWKPAPPKLYPLPNPPLALIEGDNGALLISMRGGIKRFVDGKAAAYPLPGVQQQQFDPYPLLRDHAGGLWIGTQDRGILHVHQGRTDLFTESDGLSSDFVRSLFEDREGNIWVATRDGLDRFRDFAVPTISGKQGLSSSNVWSVLAARDGSIWLGTSQGLNRWNDGQITIYRKESGGLPDNSVGSLFQDDSGRVWVSTSRGVAYFENGRFVPVSSVPAAPTVWSIAGDREGSLWISSQGYGLFHLIGGSVAAQIPWAKLGRRDEARSLLPDSLRGGLWLGFREGGVAYLKDGQVRAFYAETDGLGGGIVGGLQLDRDGTLWAATQGGLSRVKNGRVATLTSKNGLPCDATHWAMEDDAHSVWLYMACGLVRIERAALDAWAADSKRTIEATVFDSSDGVRIRALTTQISPLVTKSADGKLWFLPFAGVSVIDPSHLPVNKLPPPVHVEEVKVDGKDWDASRGWRLPALTRDLEIHYTALSLVAPEKNRFKYKLEGHDPDWKDAGNDRKAFYNDLPPRHYRFRVIACNNSGVWNEAGDSLDFSIDPAYYQTTWFRASCVAAFLALLWALHLYRLHQIAERFNARLEGRVDERLRVARDLHDTLLQSFHGLLMRFQGAVNLLPGRAADARQVLEAAVDDAARAITEARDAVQDLRSSAEITNDLAKAVDVMGKELAEQQRVANGDAPAFSVEIQGTSRDLQPILRDEVYRMTGEALRNAFRHARARRIEVEIRYDAREFRIRVRDDGIGIDASVLQEGRAGHYGQPGMRERAKSIGGQLEVWSEREAGTEIELTIPAKVAYRSYAGRRFRLFSRKAGTPR
jgi:signal transduction histidine kinase